jgi:hypothetical protein
VGVGWLAWRDEMGLARFPHQPTPPQRAHLKPRLPGPGRLMNGYE